METPKVYISFDYEKNSNGQTQFVDLLKQSNIDVIIDGFTSKPAYPDNQWQNVISDKINYCNMLIVLVSKTTTQQKWVQKEVNAAVSQAVPVFGVYVGGADSTTALPLNLPRERVVNLNATDIASYIKKAMTEGKNEMVSDKTIATQASGHGADL
ncbi:MAG TPA: TIR domain-containing protein [Bacteroidia bacterium]|nr:TIR domain-containing protein [Bacteroidia bacterium]